MIRRLLALMLCLNLLLLSSMPMLPVLALCLNDTDATQVSGMHAGHGQHAKRAGIVVDRETDCIECGCGCHRSIDSLPHAFSPHMVPEGRAFATRLPVNVTKAYRYSQIFYLSLVELPPPDLS